MKQEKQEEREGRLSKNEQSLGRKLKRTARRESMGQQVDRREGRNDRGGKGGRPG